MEYVHFFVGQTVSDKTKGLNNDSFCCVFIGFNFLQIRRKFATFLVYCCFLSWLRRDKPVFYLRKDTRPLCKRNLVSFKPIMKHQVSATDVTCLLLPRLKFLSPMSEERKRLFFLFWIISRLIVRNMNPNKYFVLKKACSFHRRVNYNKWYNNGRATVRWQITQGSTYLPLHTLI